MEIYTIFDNKAKAYNNPFVSSNNDTAIRVVANGINRSEEGYALNAEDYSLFHIGSFDKQTGKVTPADPTHLVNCIELKEANPQMELPIKGE